MRQRDHRRARHAFLPALVARPGGQLHHVVAVGIDLLRVHPAAQANHVRQVHVRAVLPGQDLSLPASPIQLVSEWMPQQVRWMPTS